ncbi:hypothetical protein Hsar01_02341 [Haloferula sargassicola]|uniref:Uncharacterized protein n=1 Tax=Haloferula sargassicola TaxID=490096 RepID=A0ABP9UNG2_9BACT
MFRVDDMMSEDLGVMSEDLDRPPNPPDKRSGRDGPSADLGWSEVNTAWKQYPGRWAESPWGPERRGFTGGATRRG